MTPDAFDQLLKQGAPPVVLDVRSRVEFKSGHIPGAVHAPLSDVVGSAEKAVGDKESLILLVCEHGPRAQMARFFLKLRGFRNLQLLEGHMAGWRRSGRGVQKG